MPDKKSERIEQKYEKAFSQLAEIQPSFPINAKLEMAQMVEQIARTNKNIAGILKENAFPGHQGREVAAKGGKIAEEFHAETFNLDAIYKDKSSRAITDKYEDWTKKVNDPKVDIAVVKNGNVAHTSQVKYGKSPEATSRMMRKTDSEGNYKYPGIDSHIGPSDQINTEPGKDSIAQVAQRDAATAAAKGNKPEKLKGAQDVEKKATDKLEHNGTASKPLSKKNAEEIAKDTEEGRQIRKDIHDEYQAASTIKHMKQAATGAAALSAISSGVFNTVTYCKMAKEGKMSESEAVMKIIGETVSSAADSAIKASANVGVQSLLVRYGTKELSKQIAKNSLRSLVRTNVVTIGVTCGIDMIKDLVKLATGKIDKQQFEERNGKNVLNTTAGLMGSSVGYSIVASIPLAGIGLIGGLTGGLIAGLAMEFAIENHIEKPYQELVSNTAALTQSMQIFKQVSNNVLKGQIVFGAFLERENLLNLQFHNQANRIAKAGVNMKDAIDKL